MLILIAAGLILLAALVLRIAHVPIRHRWRRRQARTMCEQFHGPDRLQPAARLFARVRAMDPLAFEELLLTCFERRGHKVVRNRRYTGDGGIDGRVVLHGRVWLIQAKRYDSAVRPEHVRSFAQLCAGQRQPGLFVHTGRTGAMSRDALAGQSRVEILSGDRLVALLTGRPLSIGARAI